MAKALIWKLVIGSPIKSKNKKDSHEVDSVSNPHRTVVISGTALLSESEDDRSHSARSSRSNSPV